MKSGKIMNINLIDTIKKDCEHWQQLKDGGFYHRLYLNECVSSKESRLYQLILNDMELWYGTLQEINAVVKSMIKLIEKKDEYEI